MSQKHKLIILSICGIVFKALIKVLEVLQDEPQTLDKSVLEKEIPLGEDL